MWDRISDFLAQNQFASGGLLLGALGALAAACRAWPGHIWQFVKSRIVVTVEILSQDEAFNWLRDWLAEHPYTRSARRLSVHTKYPHHTDRTLRYNRAQAGKPEVLFSPSPGVHILRYRGYWMAISRDRKEVSQQGLTVFRESFEIRVFFGGHALVRQLLEEARDTALSRSGSLQVMIPQYEDWRQLHRVQARPLSSVILPGNLGEVLRRDIEDFHNSRDWYLSLGIPYRRGYLLYGPPGNGKTSFVMAIAGELGLQLCVLNLSNPLFTDDRMAELAANLPETSALLLEDVDCAGIVREVDGEKRGVTLSGILNVLDGAVSPDGQIVFMTTNRIEALDPALIRPGRADVHAFISNATPEQAAQLFRRFYPAASEDLVEAFVSTIDGETSMATLQQRLIAHRNNPEAVCFPAEASAV